MSEPTSPTDLREKARVIVEAALERNAEDIRVLEVGELTSFADVFVLLTGRSDRQVKAIADHIARSLKEHGDPPMGIEGQNEGLWVLLDCNDIIVHVFDPEARTRYDLDRLWHDAPRLDLGIEELESQDSDTASGDDTEPPGGLKERLAR